MKSSISISLILKNLLTVNANSSTFDYKSTSLSLFTLISNIFTKIGKFNSELKIGYSQDRLDALKAMPSLSFLVDPRILITLVGILAICLHFYKFDNNETMRNIRINIRPIFLVLIMLKYAFTFLTLIFFPTFYFSFSNLLFGAHPILLISFIADIALVYSVYNVFRKENSKMSENSLNDLLKNAIKRAEHIAKGIETRKMVIGFVVYALIFGLGRIGLTNPAVVSALGNLVPNFIVIIFNNTIYPVYYLFFSSVHYPFVSSLNSSIMSIFQSIVNADVLLFSWLISLAMPLIRLAIRMAISALFIYILKHVITFFTYFLDMTIIIRTGKRNKDNENLDSDDQF